MSTTIEKLTNALRQLGLIEGNSLIVHSSFRSLKPFDGGPLDVLRAIRSVIGPRGNIVLPAFNEILLCTNPSCAGCTGTKRALGAL